MTYRRRVSVGDVLGERSSTSAELSCQQVHVLSTAEEYPPHRATTRAAPAHRPRRRRRQGVRRHDHGRADRGRETGVRLVSGQVPPAAGKRRRSFRTRMGFCSDADWRLAVAERRTNCELEQLSGNRSRTLIGLVWSIGSYSVYCVSHLTVLRK